MLQIPLSAETEVALRERADSRGEEVAVYAARLLQDAVAAPNIDELLAPFRRQVEENGATDAELDSLCEELRRDVWQEQQARKAQSA